MQASAGHSEAIIIRVGLSCTVAGQVESPGKPANPITDVPRARYFRAKLQGTSGAQ